MKVRFSLILLTCLSLLTANGKQTKNEPAREQWFMDMGFGMFIHWSMDSQVGAVNVNRLYTNNLWPNPVFLKMENVTYTPAISENDRQNRIDGAR
jgi:predicted branched-subunit amino acid permease